MFILKRKRSRLVFLLVLAVILAAATYGFAAANTVNGGTDMYLGEGSGTISGYSVTNISYTLDTNNPHQITAVGFDLDATATTVEISLDDTNWETCSNSGGNAWTCTLTTAVDVSAATSLDVFASDQTIN